MKNWLALFAIGFLIAKNNIALEWELVALGLAKQADWWNG
jgi:hypothetical protein